jgi:hypothetical protein
MHCFNVLDKWLFICSESEVRDCCSVHLGAIEVDQYVAKSE